MENNENPEPALSAPDSFLRLKIREYAQKQRHNQRDQATDAFRFGLGQIRQEITELDNLKIKDVQGLAARIKRRKHATSENMYRLSHAFLQGNENINCFAAIPGASQVLVKELTGPNLERQIEAAECFCNYSLGEPHVAEKISTMAGSYLVTYLDSNELRLKRSCLWTLTNLIATCPKAGKTLLQMQLIPKLWKLYVSDYDELHTDAEISLNLLATTIDGISPEDCHYLSEHMMEKRPSDLHGEYYMFLLYQWEIECKTQKQAEYLIDFFLNQKEINYNNNWSIRYGIRLLANVFYKHPELIQNFSNFEQFANKLNQLFAKRDQELNFELLRMLRNLMELKLCNNNLWLNELKFYG
ncbi:uncharacterized protein Dwil_GK23924 [Drosophila willistoni]|uniref:Uncharacterized protein n=1 Tax=Drosophila willistoni TaxID=7260 RepID=B4MTX4_DROWI|nr:uncharacterized protein LOC6641594 [Drosophila willistoni]EDW75563.2 uncharacterized protein Dwil_GK23924 [Drosophila willistoni]